jgi:hypothetical protein
MFGKVSNQDRTGKRIPTTSDGLNTYLYPLILLILVALLLLSASCAGRGSIDAMPESNAASMGVYRARVSDGEGQHKKFKLLLFAELPDRLHGEIVSPVGSTVAIFDGGAGTLSVSLLRERLAFVGNSGPEALERVCGLPISLSEMVHGLLGEGVKDRDVLVTRTPANDGLLPAMLEITASGNTLHLELRRVQPVRGPLDALGTGRPPAGLEIRPLEELTLYPIPLDSDR